MLNTCVVADSTNAAAAVAQAAINKSLAAKQPQQKKVRCQ